MSTSIDPEANLLPDQTRPNMPISEQEKANYMEPGAPNSPLNLKNDHDVATYSGHDGASSQEVGHSVGQGTDKPNITPNDPDKGTRLTTKKNVQAVQSDRLVEDRIQAIEAQVKALLGNSQPTSSTQAQPPLASKNSQLQALAPVRDSSGKFENKPVLVPLDEFRVTPQVGRFNESEYEEAYEFTGLKKCAVDLLIPDGGGEAPKKGALTPEYPDVSPAANKTESEDRAVSNDELQPSTTISATSTASSKPKRARINSRKLLIDLLDVAGQVRDTLGRQFLAPFQIFTLHEDKIRRRVEELERQCSRKDTTLEVKEVAPAPKEEDCSKSSQDAHRDLEMVDQEIGADILEIMERCQVGIQKAGDAFHAQRSSVSSKTSGAISDILRSMTEEERGMVDNLYTKSLLEEWKCLIDFLDTDLRSTLETCAQIREGTLKVIAYEDLMYLFNPGDIVLSHQNRRLQALAVLTASGGRPLLYKPPAYHRFSILDRSEEPFLPADKQNPFTVSCWYYDFDGVTAGMVSKRFLIPKYDGVKTVTPPPISPANLHTFRGREILEHLTQRGNKYVALCSEKAGAHRQYRARTLDDTPEEVDSQVIVDYQMAALVQPEKLPDQSQWIPVLGMDPPKELDSREIYESASLRRVAIFNDNRMNRGRAILYINSWGFIDDNMEIENTEPKFRMLFPPPVFGFILRSRKWARLDVEKIREITHSSSGFERLVLQEGYDDLVLALVKTHFKDPLSDKVKTRFRHQFDVVRGKGKGLIILLHGAPGVGKTSTAETVAEHTKRPLLTITCGDIRETAREVEENLDRCFQMAQKWDCVLLLDEADVFLAKRDRLDFKRNALVSVFLRVLEYYAGILFLTTNRVGTFDEAFKSRIHVSLYYAALDLKSTIKIWEMNIGRTREKRDAIKINDDEILGFAEQHFKAAQDGHRGIWNGRQIRNAFQTAIALAEWDASKSKKEKRPRLTADCFHQVAKAYSDFDRYLNSTLGNYDEEYRAAHYRERAPIDWDEVPYRQGEMQRVPYPQGRPPPESEQRIYGRDNNYHSRQRSERAYQESYESPPRGKAKVKSSRPTRDTEGIEDRKKKVRSGKKAEQRSDEEDDGKRREATKSKPMKVKDRHGQNDDDDDDGSRHSQSDSDSSTDSDDSDSSDESDDDQAQGEDGENDKHKNDKADRRSMKSKK